SLTEYDKAMAYLNSALDIYRDHKSTRDSARTRLNLGRTLMLAGQLVRAEGIMKQALKEVTEDRAASLPSATTGGTAACSITATRRSRSTIPFGMRAATL
ncbi:MAG: tetratricopeptide repeat protein, partial [Acidobacteriia bacterium]|nr:tetratricopeptide repeat protein [Terriglobia bacterium]